MMMMIYVSLAQGILPQQHQQFTWVEKQYEETIEKQSIHTHKHTIHLHWKTTV